MKNDVTSIDRLEALRDDLSDGIVDMLLLRHFSIDDNPTAGDGIGIWWGLEESTNNTEFNAAALDILSTDINSGAEDVDWRFSTMIAGTLTEYLHVDADGGFIIELSPLVLSTDDAITEFRVHNWAVDGDPIITWALGTEAVADIKFAMGVDDGDGDLLKLYSEDWQGAGVALLEVSAAATGLWKHLQGVEIETTTTAARSALLIDNNDTDQIALEFEAANISADVIQITADAVTSAGVIDATIDGLTTGFGLRLASTSAVLAAGELATMTLTTSGSTITAKTGALVSIASSRTELAAAATADDYDVFSVTRTNITDTVGTLTAAGSVARLENIATQTAGTLTDNVDVLEIVQDAQSTGQSVIIDHNPNSIAVNIDAENTTADVIDISAAILTEGTVIDISDLDAITIGKAIHVDATGVTQTTGILVHIDSASTALTGAGRLLLVDSTGDFNDVAGIVAEIQTVHTTGIGFQLTMDAVTDGIGMFGTFDGLTTGEGVSLTHTTSVIADGGSLLRLSSTGINTGGATNGTVFDLSATAQAAGTVAKITSSGTTTGDVFDITATNQTSGNLITLTGGGAGTLTGGSLARFDNSGATTGALLELINTTGVYTSTEGMLNIDANMLTIGTVVDINAAGLISGNGIIVNGGGANMIAGGALIRLDMGAAIAGSGLEIVTSGVYAGTEGLLDISAAALTSGTVIDIGDLDGITTGRGINIASGSEAIAAGELATIALTSSGSTITAKTGALVSIASSRTELAAAATADDYDVFSVIRTNITDTLGTLTAAGSVARFENVATQTAGTLTDDVDVLEIVQDADSTGQSINIDHNSATNAITIVSGSDAATSSLQITNEAGGFGINVSRNLVAAATDSALVYINDDGASDQYALHIQTDAVADAGGGALFIDADVMTTLNPIELTADALSSGIGALLSSTSTALTTNGRLLRVIHSADFNDAGGYIAEISGAFTTGRGLNIVNDVITDGFLTHINSASAVLDATGRMLMIDHTGAATISGVLAEIASNAIDETVIARVTASAALALGTALDISVASMTTGTALDISDINSLTSGIGVHVASSATAITGVGRLIYVNHTGTTSTSGILHEIASAATDETVISRITASAALAAGTALDITVPSMTTGTALDIGDLDSLDTGVGLNIASGSEAIAAGELATIRLTSSGSTITAKTGSLVSIASTRTESAAAATADNYDVFSVIRTNITDTLGTLTANGSVVRLENVATQTAGTLTDNVDVLEIVQDAQSTGQSITIDHNPDSIAINIDAENVATNVFDISAAILTTGKVLDISDLDAFTTGKALHIDATGITQTDGILIHLDSASTALTATGKLLLSDHTGVTTISGVLNEFRSAATDETTIARITASAALAAGVALDVSVASMTSGTALDIGNLAAIIDGKGINVASQNNTLTSGILVDIAAASTGLTTNGRLLKVAHSADFDDAGGYIAEISGAFTTGRGLNVVNDAITDGFLTHINSSSTVIDATGRLFIVDHTGASTAAQGAIAEIASAAADDTTIFKVTASAALAAGIAADISVAAVTTGMALDISDADALTSGGIANFTSNSADVTARQLVHIHNDNSAATGTIPLNITNDAASNDLEIDNIDGGATGVVLALHHDSAGPAVDDVVARIQMDGEDSGSAQTTFARIDAIIADATAGSEEGRVIHYTAHLDGTATEDFRQEVGDLKPVRENSQSYEWIEDFDDEASGVQFEAGLVADFWTTAGTNYNANNVTYAAGPNGTVAAITAGADNDSVNSMGVAIWRIDQNPILEARFKVLDITNVWIAVGFVEGAFADKAAPDDDIAVVGIDSDNGHGFGAAQIVAVTNDANASVVYSDCGVAISADTYITIRIDLTDTEQPRVWVNNTGGQITAANEVAAASITGTVQAGISVAPYFMVQSLSVAADTFTIDYIKTWQARA